MVKRYHIQGPNFEIIRRRAAVRLYRALDVGIIKIFHDIVIVTKRSLQWIYFCLNSRNGSLFS